MSWDISLGLRRMRQAQRERQRQKTIIPVGGGSSACPRIYFLVPDYDTPSGGIRVMYRHVDILNASGTPAVVLHQKKGFRCTWFDNQTNVTSVEECSVGPADLLVVGELDVDHVAASPVGLRHVVLNQSGFLTWKYHEDRVRRHYASSPGLVGVVTVSEYARRLLKESFPGRRVERVRPSVDTKRFVPHTTTPPRRIAYMDRRGTEDVRLVLNVVRESKFLKGWEVRAVGELSHADVARELRESAIFLTTSYHEGFGLPPLEAMACGSYVVGYHGYGGLEFFDREYCSPVITGDVLGLAQELISVIKRDLYEPGWIRERALAASAHVRDRYSPMNEALDVTTVYSGLLLESQRRN